MTPRPPDTFDGRTTAPGWGSRRRSVLVAIGLAFALLALACEPAGREPGAASTTSGGGSRSALAPSGLAYSEERVPCADRDPLRQAFWGELHVHSDLSADAFIWDVRGGPDEIYRFARGEEIRLAPLDAAGRPTRPIQLERPLDFVALTDHASFQGEVALCSRPGSALYESDGCRLFRGEVDMPPSPFGAFGIRIRGIQASADERRLIPMRNPALCGEDGEACRAAMRSVWTEQLEAAERYYDRSERCALTTFPAYEYTATPGMAKVHHNVIFRNADVPSSPMPWVDVPDVYDLWRGLRTECVDAGGRCDVLTIPHNSNLSNGRMFEVTGRDLPIDEQRSRALLRADLERLVEISQIKGDSECRNGMYRVLGEPDEFCDFEEWRGPEVEDCEEGTGVGALAGLGCVSRRDYVRYALLEGQREQARIGVNPYKLGILAATDQHNANPGDVEEYSYSGWSGNEDASPERRLVASGNGPPARNPLASNPGGIAGVWAEENSRDSIFDAMKRRETFGTSGPRMTARFFGGWGYPEDLCASASLVEAGYAGGVPMGADLPPRPEGAVAPSFVVSAMRDPGTPGHPGTELQRAQIVKGWVDDEGHFHQAVFDVAGGANDAGVDLATCEPRGPGHDALCSVWTDPDFDPDQRAVYYVRVLENPSCRWNQLQCLELPADERPSGCEDPSVPKQIQERLWTSPIWYEGASAG
ncbi:MAG: DUF3604 domain-containing protein [Spirochaetaceae bacterium]|nr:DUF3604 domain-containing protein [Myxococcales bacterium]MCB9723908.1 DUF3604 domain-containing protein [Spirochaetaceae bacterium]HPG27120.1 DUF3604 domain-containing protein [Myxococcota bacterium]